MTNVMGSILKKVSIFGLVLVLGQQAPAQSLSKEQTDEIANKVVEMLKKQGLATTLPNGQLEFRQSPVSISVTPNPKSVLLKTMQPELGNASRLRGSGGFDLGGGGTEVSGQLRDFWEIEGAVDFKVTELPVFRKYIQPKLENLRFKLPDIYILLNSAVYKTWTFTPKELQCGDLVSYSFENSSYAACQDSFQVWINSDWFHLNEMDLVGKSPNEIEAIRNLKEKNQAGLIMHELVRNVELRVNHSKKVFSEQDVRYMTRVLLNIEQYSDIQLRNIMLQRSFVVLDNSPYSPLMVGTLLRAQIDAISKVTEEKSCEDLYGISQSKPEHNLEGIENKIQLGLGVDFQNLFLVKNIQDVRLRVLSLGTLMRAPETKKFRDTIKSFQEKFEKYGHSMNGEIVSTYDCESRKLIATLRWIGTWGGSGSIEIYRLPAREAFSKFGEFYAQAGPTYGPLRLF